MQSAILDGEGDAVDSLDAIEMFDDVLHYQDGFLSVATRLQKVGKRLIDHLAARHRGRLDDLLA